MNTNSDPKSAAFLPAAHAATSRVPRLLKTLASVTLLFVAVWCLVVLVALSLWALTLHQNWHTPQTRWVTHFPFTSFPLVPAVLTALAWWGGLRRRPVWGVAGALLLLPVMAYLATDDAEWRSPLTTEDVAAAFPGEKESEAVFLRYAKNSEAAKAWQPSVGLPEKWLEVGTPEWEASLKTYADAIATAWAGPNPVRDWWGEWSALPGPGDSTAFVGGSPILEVRIFRSHVQLATAEAGRLALAGQGDAAFAILEPLLVGGQKLVGHGRSAIRFMLANFAQRLALKAVPFVLDHAPVSSEARARLARVLAETEEAEKSIRRLFASEYAQATQAVLVDFPRAEVRLERGRSYLGGILGDGFMDPVLFNPKRTANRLHEVMQELGERAVQRDAKGAEERIMRFLATGGASSGIKNAWGGQLSIMLVPNLITIIPRLWEVEDLRVNLLATLRGEAGAAPPTTQSPEAQP